MNEILLNFSNENWHSFDESKKSEIINDLIKQMCNDKNLYNLMKIPFDINVRDISFGWKNKDELDGDGECISNKFGHIKICLSREFSSNDDKFPNGEYQGFYAYTTLMHELTHAIQDTIIFKSKILPFDKNLKNYSIPLLSASKRNTNVKIFNNESNSFKNVKGDLLIQPITQYDSSNVTTNINDISTMFYRLNIVERTAYNIECLYGIQMAQTLNDYYKNNIYHYDKLYLIEQYNAFKQRYNCSHLSNEQVNQLVDKCYVNIQSNMSPKDELSQSIMYDLCCIAALKKGKIEPQDCSNLLMLEEKEIILPNNIYAQKINSQAEYPYNYNSYVFGDKNFNQLTNEQKIKNTLLALYIYCKNNDIIKEEQKIFLDNKLKQEMKQYCLENISTVLNGNDYLIPKLSKLGIEKAFGEEFYQTLLYINDKFPNIPIDDKIYSELEKMMNIEKENKLDTSTPQNNIEKIPNDIKLDTELDTENIEH